MREFEIKFSGLKNGKHDFKFEIRDAFFQFDDQESIANDLIHGGNLTADVLLDKKENMLVFEFEIRGLVKVSCDLCMGPMQTSIETSRRIVGKFSDEETWHDDDIIHLPMTSYKIDLRELLMEFIVLALPSKNVHEEGECDPAMLAKLEEYRIVEKEEEETDIDPRWEQLKKLK